MKIARRQRRQSQTLARTSATYAILYIPKQLTEMAQKCSTLSHKKRKLSGMEGNLREGEGKNISPPPSRQLVYINKEKEKTMFAVADCGEY